MFPPEDPLSRSEPLLPLEALALRDRTAGLLDRLGTALEATEAEEAVRRLASIRHHLDDGLLVIVVGEFNAGKSSVLNALFGQTVLAEGPVPTTDRVTFIRYGLEPSYHLRDEYLAEQILPHPLLQGLSLVDTPGTNSLVRAHQRLTEDALPRADLLLFVTSFDRPLSESERQFLEYASSDWGRRVAVVVNKADLAASAEDLDRVLAHVRDGFAHALGLKPPIFPVSARRARRGETESGFEVLRRFLEETLAGPEALALHLHAPLDAAAPLLDRLAEHLRTQRATVEADAAALARFSASLAREEAALRTALGGPLAEIDAALLALEQRGDRFLDDTIRVTGLPTLRDRERFRTAFERHVMQQSEREIDAALGSAVDRLMSGVLTLWNQAHAFAAEQARRTGAPSSYLYDRDPVYTSIQRAARRYTERYDLHAESNRLLEQSRSAATFFAGTQATAVGLGTLAGVLVAATAFDVTGGFVAAGALSALGFGLLPRQRRRARKAFRERVEALRQELRRGLEAQFASETEEALAGVRRLVEPVSALVAEGTNALERLEAEQVALRESVGALRDEVRTHFGTPSV